MKTWNIGLNFIATLCGFLRKGVDSIIRLCIYVTPLPLTLPSTDWTNWPINEFHVSKLNVFIVIISTSILHPFFIVVELYLRWRRIWTTEKNLGNIKGSHRSCWSFSFTGLIVIHRVELKTVFCGYKNKKR